jgi:hypothetical protein
VPPKPPCLVLPGTHQTILPRAGTAIVLRLGLAEQLCWSGRAAAGLG